MFFFYDEPGGGYAESVFESIKHINEYDQEFWYARELQNALEYARWENFYKAISRAVDSCTASGNEPSDHFREVTKIVEAGATQKPIIDYELSRYACYLIVMNGDPSKGKIAEGQTYFAIKTRQQELSEQFPELSEDEKRLAIREELKRHNKSLADAAHDAGVVEPRDYATFQNYGYMGLYGGLKVSDIRTRKGLKDSEDILDHMGSTELAANLFRATQTDEKLRRDNIQGKAAANQTHYDVGKKVRQTIDELGGTMPEDLPTPDKSIKEIKKEKKKPLK